MAVDVLTETVIDARQERGRGVRLRPRQRAALVRQHQVGRVADGAAAAPRFARRLRRRVPGQAARLHLRGDGVPPGRAPRDAHDAGPVPHGDHLRVGVGGKGGTRMTLRNRGEPSGFSRLAAPVMAATMRKANRKDLEQLKRLLEAPYGLRRAVLIRPTPHRPPQRPTARGTTIRFPCPCGGSQGSNR